MYKIYFDNNIDMYNYLMVTFVLPFYRITMPSNALSNLTENKRNWQSLKNKSQIDD